MILIQKAYLLILNNSHRRESSRQYFEYSANITKYKLFNSKPDALFKRIKFKYDSYLYVMRITLKIVDFLWTTRHYFVLNDNGRPRSSDLKFFFGNVFNVFGFILPMGIIFLSHEQPMPNVSNQVNNKMMRDLNPYEGRQSFCH